MSTPSDESAEYVDQDSEATTQAPEGESPTDLGPIEEARAEDQDGSSLE